jgi:hypothetical protein
MIKISYRDIIPISDHYAVVKLKTIHGEELAMSFLTVEDLKHMPDEVTVSMISSISKVKEVV